MNHPLPIMIPIYKWWEVPYMWIGAKVCEVQGERGGGGGSKRGREGGRKGEGIKAKIFASRAPARGSDRVRVTRLDPTRAISNTS